MIYYFKLWLYKTAAQNWKTICQPRLSVNSKVDSIVYYEHKENTFEGSNSAVKQKQGDSIIASN